MLSCSDPSCGFPELQHGPQQPQPSFPSGCPKTHSAPGPADTAIPPVPAHSCLRSWGSDLPWPGMLSPWICPWLPCSYQVWLEYSLIGEKGPDQPVHTVTAPCFIYQWWGLGTWHNCLLCWNENFASYSSLSPQPSNSA